MRCTWIIILAMAMAAWSSAQSTAPTTRPAGVQARVDLLLKQLGADDWQARQKAQDELVKMGEDVVPALQAFARRAADEEARTRAEAAAGQILKATLPAVRTWGELASQPRLNVGGGVTVRLGISAKRVPVNYGALIYCLCDGYDPLNAHQIGPGRLGPLWVDLERDGAAARARPELMAGGRSPMEIVRNCTLFFTYTALVDAAGAYEMVIRNDAGQEIGRARLTADDSFYQPWTRFQMEQQGDIEIGTLQRDERGRLLPDQITSRYTKPDVLSVPGGILLPNQGPGWTYEVYSGTVGGARAREVRPKDFDALLPVLVPETPDPKLHLSMKDGVVELKADDRIAGTGRERNLLARFWVNGKPFIPDRGDRTLRPLSRDAHSTATWPFKLKLDPAKMGARAGDRVAMQLLWCFGANPVYASNSGTGEFSHAEARLTNKIEFVVE